MPEKVYTCPKIFVKVKILILWSCLEYLYQEHINYSKMMLKLLKHLVFIVLNLGLIQNFQNLTVTAGPGPTVSRLAYGSTGTFHKVGAPPRNDFRPVTKIIKVVL